MAQKNNNGKRTPAYSTDAMVVYMIFGLLFIALGVLIVLTYVPGMTGDVFDGLRQFTRGMCGVMTIVLPVIPIWGGVLMMISIQRKPSLRAFLLAVLLLVLLCTAATLLTFYGSYSTSLTDYIQDVVQASGMADTMPPYLTQGFTFGSRGAGGGLIGMLLAWPLWKGFGAIGGGIFVILAIVVTFLFLIKLDVKGIAAKTKARNDERRARKAAEDAQRAQQELAWKQEQARIQQEQRQMQEAMRQQQLQNQYQQPMQGQQPMYPPMGYPNQQGTPIVRQVQPRGQSAAPQQPTHGFQPTPEELGQTNDAPQPAKKKRSLFSRDQGDAETPAPRKRNPFDQGSQAEPIQEPAPRVRPSRSTARQQTQPNPVFLSEEEGQQSVNPIYQQPAPAPAPVQEAPQPVEPAPAARPARSAAVTPPVPPARKTAQPPEEVDDGFAAEMQEKPTRENSFLSRLRAAKKAAGLESPEEDSAPKATSGFASNSWKEEGATPRPKARTAKPAVNPADIPPWEDIPEEAAEPAAPLRPVVTTKKPEGGYEPELNLKPRRSGSDAPAAPSYEEPVEVPYVFPTMDLLKAPEPPKGNNEAEDYERSRRLENTLQSFHIPAKVRNITHGPAISRFELEIAAGINVSRVLTVKNNIAMNMAAESIRIEAPIPGKPFVGVEVPNAERTTVTLRELLEADVMRKAKEPLVVALGKDIAGTPIICDLEKMPHLLIAGATGSGKSVCVNTIINSLLFRCSPKDVRLILIDPKVVELQCYNGIPHLLIPVVSDPHKAPSALAWAVGEMEERYKSFEEVGVRNITGYNDHMQKHDGEKLPRLVIIIDELADLMMTSKDKKVMEDLICRIAQKARAAGIYLIVATQRPSTDIITGLIKSNIPSRIAFKTASNIDSRTILDHNGAEQLLGYGDMLYKPNGKFTPVRLQGCFLSDAEVNRITDYIRETCPANYDPAVLEELERLQAEADQSSGNGSASTDMPSADDYIGGDGSLLTQCIEMAVNDGQVSTSLIQRRLRLGYSRAGRLVDEMEKRGIVGPKDGARPRMCLISREEFEAMRATGELD